LASTLTFGSRGVPQWGSVFGVAQNMLLSAYCAIARVIALLVPRLKVRELGGCILRH
jgi:hypothetical protein